jgi:hypothetical protein
MLGISKHLSGRRGAVEGFRLGNLEPLAEGEAAELAAQCPRVHLCRGKNGADPASMARNAGKLRPDLERNPVRSSVLPVVRSNWTWWRSRGWRRTILLI